MAAIKINISGNIRIIGNCGLSRDLLINLKRRFLLIDIKRIHQ